MANSDSPRKGQNGGKRAGAGRPPGVREYVPRGTASAIKALRHRVPEGTAPEVAELADEAFATVVQVMRGGKPFGARERLSAATLVREEVCGPVPKRLEHSGPDGEPLNVVIKTYKRGDDGER